MESGPPPDKDLESPSSTRLEALLQRILPTQGSNPGLLHCRRILYQLSHKGSLRHEHKCSQPRVAVPCDRSPKWRGTLRFLTPLEMRPSSITPKIVEAREAPPKSTVSRLLRGTLRSSLRSPAQVEGTQGDPGRGPSVVLSPMPPRHGRALTEGRNGP